MTYGTLWQDALLLSKQELLGVGWKNVDGTSDSVKMMGRVGLRGEGARGRKMLTHMCKNSIYGMLIITAPRRCLSCHTERSDSDQQPILSSFLPARMVSIE